MVPWRPVRERYIYRVSFNWVVFYFGGIAKRSIRILKLLLIPVKTTEVTRTDYSTRLILDLLSENLRDTIENFLSLYKCLIKQTIHPDNS